jgi:hypothetical protein
MPKTDSGRTRDRRSMCSVRGGVLRVGTVGLGGLCTVDQARYPAVPRAQHLQMACEKLAKAYRLRNVASTSTRLAQRTNQAVKSGDG